jgi:2,4-dienoyl-CoA reductase (NADPH2)
MASSKNYERLLEPGYIGKVRTRNRMVKSGAAMLYWHEDETDVPENMMAFYEALARGGVGLLVVESPTIDYPYGRRWNRRYRIDDDKYIPGLKKLVDVIHKYDCPTFMQMNHDGPWQSMWGPTPIIPGPPIGSSPTTLNSPLDFHNEPPRELSVAEIEEIINKFANAAVRAEKAGFDGIDINAGSSHLLHNFLSPYWNRRTDEYGGSPENRARFLVQIVQEMKKRVGSDYPVAVTINGIEIGQVMNIDNQACMTPEYSRKIARILDDAGVDAIQVRSHWLGRHTSSFMTEAIFYPEPPVPLEEFPPEYNRKYWGKGANMTLSAGLKKILTIPLMVVGRMGPELGEQALKNGEADFIVMTRRLLADPELPNKVASGRLHDIAVCTACDTCIDAGGVKRCRINGALGTDNLWSHQKPEKKKNVVVIGGGPAGMEAARIAATRGHKVSLYDSQYKLGGMIPMAALVKGTEIEPLPDFVRYFKNQLKELGVDVHLGIEIDVAAIQLLKPDAVIVATGGLATVPDIPGIDKPIVVKGGEIHKKLKTYLRFLGPGLLRKLTKYYLPIGQRVIVLGGEIQGAELSEFLVKRGRHVTIVDTGEFIGAGMIMHLRQQLLIWFEKKGVKMLTGVKYEEITDKGLTLVDRDGKRQTLEADTIVTALPLTPNTELADKLKGIVPEVYMVGDCREPRLIVDAIRDGLETGHNI